MQAEYPVLLMYISKLKCLLAHDTHCPLEDKDKDRLLKRPNIFQKAESHHKDIKNCILTSKLVNFLLDNQTRPDQVKRKGGLQYLGSNSGSCVLVTIIKTPSTHYAVTVSNFNAGLMRKNSKY